ncbi:MAG: 30S ribosomal protein S6 [Chthoniobacterales bacterium]
MKNKYEVLLALDLRGKEDGAKETVERLEKEFKAEGAAVESIQRLEKRQLAYEHKHTNSAYFVNFVFEAEPALVDKLQKKFKLDEAVTMQHYQKVTTKKAAAAKE